MTDYIHLTVVKHIGDRLHLTMVEHIGNCTDTFDSGILLTFIETFNSGSAQHNHDMRTCIRTRRH